MKINILSIIILFCITSTISLAENENNKKEPIAKDIKLEATISDKEKSIKFVSTITLNTLNQFDFIISSICNIDEILLNDKPIKFEDNFDDYPSDTIPKTITLSIPDELIKSKCKLVLKYTRPLLHLDNQVVLGAVENENLMPYIHLSSEENWFPEFDKNSTLSSFIVTLPVKWVTPHATDYTSPKKNKQTYIIKICPENRTVFFTRHHIDSKRIGKVNINIFTEKKNDNTHVYNEVKNYFSMFSDMLGKFPQSNIYIVEEIDAPFKASKNVFMIPRNQINTQYFLSEVLRTIFLNSWISDKNDEDFSQSLINYLTGIYSAEKIGGLNKASLYRKNLLKNYSTACFILSQKRLPFERSEALKRSHNIRKIMFFQMAKDILGEKSFTRAIKNTIKKNPSWETFQKHFNKLTKNSDPLFFKQWLYNENIPSFNITKLFSIPDPKGYRTFITINKEPPDGHLTLPVFIETYKRTKIKDDGSGNAIYEKNKNNLRHTKIEIGKMKITQAISEQTFVLKWKPHKIIIDPDYKILRKLSIDEMPPSFHSTIASDKAIIVYPTLGGDRKNETYFNAAQFLSKRTNIPLKKDVEVTMHTYQTNSIIILGDWRSNALLARIRLKCPPEMILEVNSFSLGGKVYNKLDNVLRASFPNPDNPKKQITIIFALSKRALEGYIPLIMQQGWDSWEIYEDGKIIRSGNFFGRDTKLEYYFKLKYNIYKE